MNIEEIIPTQTLALSLNAAQLRVPSWTPKTDFGVHQFYEMSWVAPKWHEIVIMSAYPYCLLDRKPHELGLVYFVPSDGVFGTSHSSRCAANDQ